MYHSRKIGVFISHIMGHYQKNVCQGIIDKSLEYGYTTEIFASLDGENLGSYGRGEESILNIPRYDELSGVIFASDTYRNPDLKEQFYQILREKCQCPIIEIAVINPKFPAVCLDNNSTTLQLTRHLINVHSYKRICYLGCKEQAYFSDIREQYYRQVMDEAALPVGSNDVYEACFTQESVEDALSVFTADGSTPDAVLCYNDRLALLFMQAAIQKGYRIPEDFAITGFDYSEAGQNADSPLTTVTFPAYELGATAIESLLKLIQKEQIPAQTILDAQMVVSDSCGCHKAPAHSSLFYEQSLSARISALESSILNSMRLSAELQSMLDIDDAMDLLEEHVQTIEHCKEFYLCLYSGWDSVSRHILEMTDTDEEDNNTPDETMLKLAVRDGKRLPECSFNSKTLLPQHIYKNYVSSYVYIPLYFEERNFGYVALSFQNNHMDYHFRLVNWFMNINQMLERICENKKSSIMFKHLEDTYTKDALTGLYNQHGYSQQIEILIHDCLDEGGTLTAFLFDLDRLKYINDNFGHHEGDFAIQVIGHTLASMIRSTDVCARFTGDEFYLLAKDYTKEDAEELISRVQKYLSNYNKLSNKEYTIYVSAGYAQITPASDFDEKQLDALLSLADAAMYRQKEAHHAIYASCSSDTP